MRAGNFAASFLFVTTAFLAYHYSPHAAGMLRRTWAADSHVTGATILSGAYAGYCLILLLFYGLERTPHESKSIAALRALRVLVTSPTRTLRGGLPYADRLGLLTILLKGFFGPLMLLSLFDFTRTMVANGGYLVAHASAIDTDFLRVFNSHGYWFLFQVILFVDVMFFTIGYLVEHPALKNGIRSVDPTWVGWTAALACYPPINSLTVKLLGGNVSDFPQFDDPTIHVAVNIVLLLLMGIYAAASVALNFKASNLTHRGIVSRGPYRYVRHPAYISKNAAWWLGSIPAVSAAWAQSTASALLVIGSTAAWTALYGLRAMTEEDHLRRVDGEYDAYCRKVRYRFVPGLF
jgi:protein-S-isoprenylcysteine O-methyltransferase Ste14